MQSLQEAFGKFRDSTAAQWFLTVTWEYNHVVSKSLRRRAKDWVQEANCVASSCLPHCVSFIIFTVQKREFPPLSGLSYQETPSLLHAGTTSGIPHTYMLCRAHQPQWGSPELRHSPQVVYCSHDSTGTLVTWQREEREHGKVRLWQLEGVFQNSPLPMPPRCSHLTAGGVRRG